jgi:hypothetical protein
MRARYECCRSELTVYSSPPTAININLDLDQSAADAAAAAAAGSFSLTLVHVCCFVP